MLEDIVLIILGILFLIVLPIISTIKYWNYKPLIKYALTLIWISYTVIAYEIFFPRDSYYINHLQKASEVKFADDIQIIDKYTSLMNSKAQYYSCAVFETKSNTSDIFSNVTSQNRAELPIGKNKCMDIINKIFTNTNSISFAKTDIKEILQWGYLKNSNRAFVLYQFFGMENKK